MLKLECGQSKLNFNVFVSTGKFYGRVKGLISAN